MKRCIALLLTLVSLFTLAACGAAPASSAAEPAAPAASAEPAPAPAPTNEDLYAEAEQLLKAGKYEEAAAAFEALGTFSDSSTRVKECRYAQGKDLIHSGDHSAAREVFASLGNYSDSPEIVTKLDAIDLKRSLSHLKPGNTFKMGVYEQDNDLANGPEPIDWMVIVDDEDNDRFLVVSVYLLDSKRFHEERGDVKWENSTIRSWLNTDFFNNAFTEEEKVLVPEILIDNSGDNWRKGTDSGVDTWDHVFLLSYDEVVDGLVETNARTIWDFQSIPTEYAKAAGAAIGKFGNSWWWLRTAGKDHKFIMYADYQGLPRSTGFQATHEHGTIRPAMWIYLNEDIFD